MKPQSSTETVRVVVRCRPLSTKEEIDGHQSIINVNKAQATVEITNPKLPEAPPKMFTYDAAYPPNSEQGELYEETFRSLVDSVLDGYNGTIFAYGQTGTGKTFTMMGESTPALEGVIPRAFQHIFGHINESPNTQQYLVRASYLEIYQEDIRDLLQKNQTAKLELKENADIGIYVKDLSSFVTKNVKEIEHVMTVGSKNRSTGATLMNQDSSRSHAIFVITVECSETGSDGKQHIRVGKLNLVDLAGSERQAKTGATGQRFKEATKINLSLSALGNVISALVDGKSSHVPYRDSKLTRLLQDSLGGNARTVMVANVGPASFNYEESFSTLRYADRAKQIKNKPKINEDPKDTLLREFQQEIEKLKQALLGKKSSRRRRSNASDASGGSDVSLEDQKAKLEAERQALLQDSKMRQADKDRLLKAIEERNSAIQKELDAQQAVAAKIKAMESKLLSGGGEAALKAQASAQKAELDRQQRALAEQQRKEREVLAQLEQHDEATAEITETVTGLQQEVAVKTKKLKKLWNRLQQVRTEIEDSGDEHSRNRQDLERAIFDISRELKFSSIVIENFVPLEVRDALLDRAIYDDDEQIWALEPMAKMAPGNPCPRPVANPGYRRPVAAAGLKPSANFMDILKYHSENVLILELDIPPPTTRNFEADVENWTRKARKGSLAPTLANSPAANQPIDNRRSKKIAENVRPMSRIQRRPKGSASRDQALNSTGPSMVQNGMVFPRTRGLVRK